MKRKGTPAAAVLAGGALMPTTIYRASDRSQAANGACFAADEDDAAEYLDNPGYGGVRLWSAEVYADSVLSLVDGRRNGVPHGRMARDAWSRLADVLEVDERDLRETHESVERAIDSARVRAALVAAGYEWVVYEDTYPTACVTWVYLGSEVIDLTEVD